MPPSPVNVHDHLQEIVPNQEPNDAYMKATQLSTEKFFLWYRNSEISSVSSITPAASNNGEIVNVENRNVLHCPQETYQEWTKMKRKKIPSSKQ